jgi:predicted lipoprotein with Yx(FWY)xxD motif
MPGSGFAPAETDPASTTYLDQDGRPEAVPDRLAVASRPSHRRTMMPRLDRSARTTAAVAVIATILLAACSQGTGVNQTVAPTPSTAPTGTAGPANGAGLTVELATDPNLGDYLAGKDGRALYVLTTDTPGTSTCAGSCATNWPPLVVAAGESATGGTGVSGSFATTDRADGSRQVTYNGAPLYYFIGDAAAGDVKGQGVGGVWYLASPSGGPQMGPESSVAPTRNSNY